MKSKKKPPIRSVIISKSRTNKQHQMNNEKYDNRALLKLGIPMKERQLPESFWLPPSRPIKNIIKTVNPNELFETRTGLIKITSPPDTNLLFSLFRILDDQMNVTTNQQPKKLQSTKHQLSKHSKSIKKISSSTKTVPLPSSPNPENIIGIIENYDCIVKNCTNNNAEEDQLNNNDDDVNDNDDEDGDDDDDNDDDELNHNAELNIIDDPYLSIKHDHKITINGNSTLLMSENYSDLLSDLVVNL